MHLQELARGVRAIDFEALVGRYQSRVLGPAEVVQDGGDGEGFEINVAPARDVGDTGLADEPGAHDVVVGMGVVMGSGEGYGGGYGGGVRDGYAGKDTFGEDRRHGGR
jgi:hypothetical protein